MRVTRYFFHAKTDTGVATPNATNFSDTGNIWGDTGHSVFGKVVQIRVHTVDADTGGDVQIGLYPNLRGDSTNDTGTGFLIFNRTDCLGADFIGVPAVEILNPDGTQDTGAAYIYASGERLRTRVIGGTNVGEHYIWVYVEE